MRITRILAKDPGKNILLDSSYSYDTMDNILSKQTGQGTYNYTYDALYRLTDVQVDIPGLEHEGFSYDAVGNRLSEQGIEGEWAYNDNNELLTFGTTEYIYDANGNATQLLLDGTVLFTYHDNAQDRLVKVDDVNGNTIAEYAYDPFGRRLWKDVGGTKTYFFYADEGLVAEYDASGTEIRAYGYRPDSAWTTDPLWLKQDSEYYFYQNDHLGTPQKLVKQNGAVVWTAHYTAFGQATVEIEMVTNNLRFPGQYYDMETGWHYNGFRYYDPNIGRYLRIDPMRLTAGEHNLYGYGNNNPATSRDALGLEVDMGLRFDLNVAYDVKRGFYLDWVGAVATVRDVQHICENQDFEVRGDISVQFYTGGLGTPVSDSETLPGTLHHDFNLATYVRYGEGEGAGMPIYTLNYHTPSALLDTYTHSYTWGQVFNYNVAAEIWTRVGMVGFRNRNLSFSTNNDNNMWWPIPYLAGGTDRLWTGGGLVSYLARISGEELLVEAGHQTFTGLIVGREDQVQKDGIWYYRQLDSQRQLNRADTFIRMSDGRQEISVHFFGEGYMQNTIHSTLNKIKEYFHDGELTEKERLGFFEFLEKENPTLTFGWGVYQRIRLTD